MIDGLDDDIEEVEEEVFSGRAHQPRRAHLQAQARGARVPPRAPRRWSSRSSGWRAGSYELIHPEVRTYFRDVNDHLLRAHDQLEGFRDLLTSVLRRT